VQHADGAVTTYNHLSEVLATPGPVAAGDVLGRVGSTGHSTGPHLHFEVRVADVPVDPRTWLRAHGLTL
jgi:murein DD-endopeptidase MepM/ murein hydrolase activator NlpD